MSKTESSFFSFYTLQATGNKHARCVDGRPPNNAQEKDLGPQMLGGSINPLLIQALEQGVDFDEGFISTGLRNLKTGGFRIGVHRDNHHHETGMCGCGFADKLTTVLKTAKEKRETITQNLTGLNLPSLSQQIVEETFNKISSYGLEKIKLSGDGLVTLFEKQGAFVENLDGEHQEEAALVNLTSGISLNTIETNEQNHQAFNLDLWAVLEQTQALGIDQNFALAASLILYQATEMVLVEAKGKPALPVIIHS